MLDPHDRQLLLDSLRPPAGYQVDHALATTFSLDLIALLLAPLAFSLFELGEKDGEIAPDRMAWLEAIRRHADHLTVFCQAGQIAVPRHEQLLFGYLEDSVYPVTPPQATGVFHPKVWLLRFTASDKPVRYRLLCLSRNLTFDRCWDTVVALDGELLERKKAIARNHPLGDFVKALPGMSRREIPAALAQRIAQMEDELRRVDFTLPDGFDDLAFWPIGLDTKPVWPFQGRIERLLVISPFIKEPILAQLTKQGSHHVLISRLEELQRLRPKALQPFAKVYAMTDETSDEAAVEMDPTLNGVPTTGLHAKVYVADDGWDGRVWTGSANATNAAFGRNVEFLVELRGRKSHCGVDAVLTSGSKDVALSEFLQVYEPQEALPVDKDLEALDELLDDVRRRIVALDLNAHVSEAANGYLVELRTLVKTRKALPSGVTLRMWPVTLPEASGGTEPDVTKELVATFSGVSFESLTAFFAFEVAGKKGKATLARRFVLNLPLHGAPADRKERILRYLLRDQRQVLRFILYLLGDEESQQALPLGTTGEGLSADEGVAAFGSPALFEQLVRALERSPARLDEVHRVVIDLRATPEGQKLLPEAFEAVWEPIWAARQEIGR